MRRSDRRIALCVVASIMAALFVGSTAMAQVYTDPVGFVKVDTVRNGLTMISVPLRAADNRLNGDPGCVGDMIKENLTGGMAGTTADMIWKWDADAGAYQTAFLIAGWGGEYEGKWWDPDTGDYSQMTFDPGEACWIMRRDYEPDIATITFLGWVPMEDMKTVTFPTGLTMFDYPYPVSLALNDSDLGTVAQGGMAGTVADMVWQWNAGTKTYTTAFLIDGWGAPYDGKWWDPDAADYSTIQFQPGAAFWFNRRPAEPAVWVCHRPY